jgi:hypothetical protein
MWAKPDIEPTSPKLLGIEFSGSTEFSVRSTTRTVTWKMPRICEFYATEFAGLKNSEPLVL